MQFVYAWHAQSIQIFNWATCSEVLNLLARLPLPFSTTGIITIQRRKNLRKWLHCCTLPHQNTLYLPYPADATTTIVTTMAEEPENNPPPPEPPIPSAPDAAEETAAPAPATTSQPSAEAAAPSECSPGGDRRPTRLLRARPRLAHAPPEHAAMELADSEGIFQNLEGAHRNEPRERRRRVRKQQQPKRKSKTRTSDEAIENKLGS